MLGQAGGYDEMVKLFADQATNHIAMGMPSEDVVVGPVNNKNQFDRVSGFITRVPSHARVVAGGAPTGLAGYFIAPTVIADLKQSDELIQSEIFGPVITIQKFADEAEAVAMANGVDYGLASSVWTKDHARAMRMAKAFDFGCVWFNTHIPMVAELPHCGFKPRGSGTALSSNGFEDSTLITQWMRN